MAAAGVEKRLSNLAADKAEESRVKLLPASVPRSGTTTRGLLQSIWQLLRSRKSDERADKRLEKESAIRVRVVIWDVSNVSLVDGSFIAKFRLTLFWAPKGDTSSIPLDSKKTSAKWEILSRSSVQLTVDAEGGAVVLKEDVPPISLLNAKELSGTDSAEVHMIEPTPGRRLMRWTCMYTATLTQPSLYESRRDGGLVSFPYDSHEIAIEFRVQYG